MAQTHFIVSMKTSPPSQPPRYHLRFQIVPDQNLRANARALADFCGKHHIEEVVLFFAAEEWNNGLLSKRDEDRWFDAIRQAKAILDQAGIRTSLNPWMTTLHCARGRRFPKDRPFEPMVSPLGERSRACASFADPKWRDYIERLYGRFAKLGFRVIWVEDDFRYHNHPPLTWGGGFEPPILKRFARKIGKPVTRETVVRNILKPGPPHPWRAKWMENWREIQIEVAQGLARAVEQGAEGRTKIGLMSSHPSVHSAEGRDWRRLFKAFTIQGQVAHRPHYAFYNEALGRDLIYSKMMLDIQKDFRPPGCEVAPEVENFPFTHWSKSDQQTWAEMAVCMFHGSDALLLDLFPFSGNRADAEPRIGRMLDRGRPALQWIAARFGQDLHTTGVGLPWRPDAAAHARTTAGRGMEELYVWPFEAGNFLLPYGVPVSTRRQKVNAVFGQVAWTFDEVELLEMLCGGLLLDGAAANILCERGFGPQIGVKVRRMAGREEATYSVETVVAREAGAPLGFLFNHNLHPVVAELLPLKGAHEWTTLLTPTGKRFGAATVAFENDLGGRVVTLAAPDPSTLPRSDQKQAIVQRAVAYVARECPLFAMVTGGPHLLPMQLQNGQRRFVVVFNASPDPAAPVIRFNGRATGSFRATLLPPLSQPTTLSVRKQVHSKATIAQINREIAYREFLVLEY